MNTMVITAFRQALSGKDSAWRRDMAIFYIGVPVVIGFLLGWLGARATTGWPKDQAVMFWIATCLLGTLTSDLGTRVVSTILRPLGAPLVLVLALGLVSSGIMVVPLNFAVGELFRTAGFATAGLDGLASYSLQRAVESSVVPVAIWIVSNLAFMRLTGRERYGYEAPRARKPAPAAPAGGTPAFMARVRPGLRGRLVAMKAELHYLRVITEYGEDLIHCRFSDAIEQAGDTGLQVHRSWWVAHDAIAERRGGDAPKLILRNGLTVPVSRSWASQVRAAVAGR